MVAADLLANSLTAGLLLGGFYALVTVGLSISFGLIDVVNVAHPTFMLLAGYIVFGLNQIWGIDPIIGGFILFPLFFLVGFALYFVYNRAFEVRGESSLTGLVFFFGLLILIEIMLQLRYGVDFVAVYTPYTMESIPIGAVTVPYRLLYPFLTAMVIVIAYHIFFSKTFIGTAIRAVAQDSVAVTLMGVRPSIVKAVALGFSIASTALAGGLLLAMQPLAPFIDREFIGRVFAIVVLGGMGSFVGALVGGIILGIAESLTTVFLSTGWSLAVSFGILIVVLLIKPSGLFRR